VAYGWRVEDQAKRRQHRRLGRELYKRIAVMGAHAGSVGKALEAAVGSLQPVRRLLESQVLTQARRFEDLSVDHEGKAVPNWPRSDQAVRPLTKLSAGSAQWPPTLTLGECGPLPDAYHGYPSHPHRR
jgi:DNA recombination protein RmuC